MAASIFGHHGVLCVLHLDDGMKRVAFRQPQNFALVSFLGSSAGLSFFSSLELVLNRAERGSKALTIISSLAGV